VIVQYRCLSVLYLKGRAKMTGERACPLLKSSLARQTMRDFARATPTKVVEPPPTPDGSFKGIGSSCAPRARAVCVNIILWFINIYQLSTTITILARPPSNISTRPSVSAVTTPSTMSSADPASMSATRSSSKTAPPTPNRDG